MIAILGISAFYHDSAAALLIDGQIIAAAQEERFTRKKHDSSYPYNAINYVLSEGCITIEQISYIAFYDKPFLKFERLLETYVSTVPFGLNSFCMVVPIWIKEKLFLKNKLTRKIKQLDKNFNSDKLLFSEHHFSHAASAFYPSPFEEAVIVILDGVGEWSTSSVSIGKGNKIDVIKEIYFPHSIGLLYSAFTYFIGFKVNSGEYKLMGLAPYGKPIYKSLILNKLIDLKPDGSFRLDLSYFNFVTGHTMTNMKFSKLFGQDVKRLDAKDITQLHMDIAASIQVVIEEVLSTMTRSLAEEFNIQNLCMAGGVALNCVANGKLLKNNYFKEIWIQPAAGDDGGALGTALATWHTELNKPRFVTSEDSMKRSHLGPEYSQKNIEKYLTSCGAKFVSFSTDEMIEHSAKALSEGKIIAWFQGRMEFGPRALGGRSILADPRSKTMQQTINQNIKFRENFRPFAPSVLKEQLTNWFDIDCDSPYMLLTADVLPSKRLKIPSVTHVDNSARVQTVDKFLSPKFHALIKNFQNKTGCPLLINTSFNIRGEPIVCSPHDAFQCFMDTEIDLLVIGNSILWKESQ